MEEAKNVDECLYSVSFSQDEGTYKIHVKEGISVNEVAFGVAATLKCFVRDGVIEDREQFIHLIRRYMDDPQYQELEDEK